MGAFDVISEGTLVKDALEPALETGLTLNSATSSSTTLGANTDLLRPQECRVKVATGTVTGTNPTFTLAIEASNDSTFSTGVVVVGRISLSGSAASQSNVVRWADISTQKRYVRANLTLGGTSPVYTGTTIRVREECHQRHDGDSA